MESKGIGIIGIIVIFVIAGALHTANSSRREREGQGQPTPKATKVVRASTTPIPPKGTYSKLDSIVTVKHEGHSYIVIDGYRRGGICHDPDCNHPKCKGE